MGRAPSVGSAFAPRTDHPHPISERLATTCLQRLSAVPLPARMPRPGIRRGASAPCSPRSGRRTWLRPCRGQDAAAGLPWRGRRCRPAAGPSHPREATCVRRVPGPIAGLSMIAGPLGHRKVTTTARSAHLARHSMCVCPTASPGHVRRLPAGRKTVEARLKSLAKADMASGDEVPSMRPSRAQRTFRPGRQRGCGNVGYKLHIPCDRITVDDEP